MILCSNRKSDEVSKRLIPEGNYMVEKGTIQVNNQRSFLTID